MEYINNLRIINKAQYKFIEAQIKRGGTLFFYARNK